MEARATHSIPSLYSFVTLRPERFGAIVFNPYLGVEEELDPIEAFIAGMINGRNSDTQVCRAVASRFGLSEADSQGRIGKTLATLSGMLAVSFDEGEESARPLLPDTPVFEDHGPYLSAPKSVIWDVTYACNLKCPHCLTSSRKALKRELTTDQAMALVDMMTKAKILYLSLSGGEPFLRPDIIPILKHIASTNMRLDIATNGVALPVDILKAMRDLPIFQIQVSIDGIGEQHDRFRGRTGAFDASVQTIRRLADEGISVSIGATVTAENIDDLERIMDFAVKEGCSGFKAIPFMPAGRGKKNQDRLKLTPQDHLRFCRTLEKRSKDLEGVIRVTTESSFPFLLNPPPDVRYENGPMGCSAGYDTISIGADGSMYPCPFLRDFRLGNVLKSGLNKLWRDAPVLNTLRTLEKKDMAEPCHSCSYCQTYCRGGCRASAYMAFGDFLGADPNCFKPLLDRERGAQQPTPS